jgi:hypothetical protein
MPHFYVARRGKLCNYVSTVNQDRWEYQMTFTVVKKQSGAGNLTGRAFSAPPVQVAKWGAAHGSVLLTNSIMDQLGWKKKDRVEISIGSGEDNGMIALRRAADGFAIGTSGSSKHQGKINCRALLSHITKAPSTGCKYQIVRDTLYIQLPARLMAPEARDGGTVMRPAFTNGQLVAAE